MEIELPDDVVSWLDLKARKLGHGNRARAAAWVLGEAMAADNAGRTSRYEVEPPSDPTGPWQGLMSQQRRRVDGR